MSFFFCKKLLYAVDLLLMTPTEEELPLWK